MIIHLDYIIQIVEDVSVLTMMIDLRQIGVLSVNCLFCTCGGQKEQLACQLEMVQYDYY